MAKSPGTSTGSDNGGVDPAAPFGRKADGTPRKRKGASGPRKSKPIHVVFQAVGQDGAPVPGLSLNVLYAGKDTDQVLSAMENPGAQRTKITIDAAVAAQ